MKKIFVILMSIAILKLSDTLLIKPIADRTKSKVEQKARGKNDKGIEYVVDGKKMKKKKPASENKSGNTDQTSSSKHVNSYKGDNSSSTRLKPIVNTILFPARNW